jgi:hypothetical protein
MQYNGLPDPPKNPEAIMAGLFVGMALIWALIAFVVWEYIQHVPKLFVGLFVLLVVGKGLFRGL